MVKRSRLSSKGSKPRKGLQKIKMRYAGMERKTAYSLFDIPSGWKLESAIALPDTHGRDYMVVKLKRVKR